MALVLAFVVRSGIAAHRHVDWHLWWMAVAMADARLAHWAGGSLPARDGVGYGARRPADPPTRALWTTRPDGRLRAGSNPVRSTAILLR